MAPLADRYRQSNYDTGELINVILRSCHFFSAHAYRQRVKGPAEYLCGLIHCSEVDVARADAAVPTLEAAMESLGQQLFAPPNVKGWEGGRAWLNTATLLARHNAAAVLLEGTSDTGRIRVSPTELARKNGAGVEPEQLIDFLLGLFLQSRNVSASSRQKLVDFFTEDDARGAAREQRLKETCHAILVMPEYQLA